jgi:tRNA wybutosine-synthesizing protein 3
MDKFLIRKKDVLSRLDKSSKNGWDKRIRGLCEKINFLEDYYTTSSCAGRVVLMIDEDKKKQGLFIKVYHDKVELRELKKRLASLCSEIDKVNNKKGFSVNNSKKSRVILERGKTDTLRAYPETVPVGTSTRGKFKMEPCILHVACRDLKSAQMLFDKAKFAGWKKSGIIASENRVMLELNSTERLEFPVVCGGEIIVEDKFLEIVVNEANKKLEKSWEKIEKLKKLLEK